MVDLATIIPAAIAGGGFTWAMPALLAWLNNRGDGNKARIAADVELEKHRDSLTFEILSAARSEVAALRGEVDKLRPMEAHLFQLEQALDHLDALLNASPEEMPNIQRSARAFVKRMRRAAEARGTIANEVQRLDSGIHIAERMARDKPPPQTGD